MKLCNRYRLMVFLTAAILLLPWGGCTRFNTKGEPREAIVAVAMLQSDDWVLPESYGEDIPYKPPMLAWCIAGCSVVLNGGEVSEYTSRLPSALAAIALTMMTYSWVRRRRDDRTAAATALVMLTSFEVFRAAVVCRVDMLLTLFIVGAVYLLDTTGVESHRRRVWMYIGAWLMMVCATLTKGPVGALLPCLAIGVFRLLEGRGFWKTFGILAGLGAASLGVAMIWYYAAWLQGGERFLQLALEENVGRLTGSMSYDSHLNPWYYNVYITLAGMLPWTAIALFGLLKVKWRRPDPLKVQWERLKALHPDSLLALTTAVVVFVFYCIPASKRSVYLLPCYPFMAFGIVLMVERIQSAGHWRKIRLIPTALEVCCCYLLWLAVIQPMVLNSRSNYEAAADIARIQPSGNVYSYINDEHHLDRYYTVDFYLGDRMRRLEDGAPAVGSEALLLTDKANLPELERKYPKAEFKPVGVSFKSCDRHADNVTVYQVRF